MAYLLCERGRGRVEGPCPAAVAVGPLLLLGHQCRVLLLRLLLGLLLRRRRRATPGAGPRREERGGGVNAGTLAGHGAVAAAEADAGPGTCKSRCRCWIESYPRVEVTSHLYPTRVVTRRVRLQSPRARSSGCPARLSVRPGGEFLQNFFLQRFFSAAAAFSFLSSLFSADALRAAREKRLVWGF